MMTQRQRLENALPQASKRQTGDTSTVNPGSGRMVIVERHNDVSEESLVLGLTGAKKDKGFERVLTIQSDKEFQIMLIKISISEIPGHNMLLSCALDEKTGQSATDGPRVETLPVNEIQLLKEYFEDKMFETSTN